MLRWRPFLGALAYADDIVLICPSATAMRQMLRICDCYAAEYHVSFNATKSKCMFFANTNSKRRNMAALQKCSFVIGGNHIELVKSFTHLGHIINDNLDDHSDIAKARSTFIGQVNNVLCYFSKLGSSVKYRLFKSYCTSYYGSELWSLQHSDLNLLDITWRKATRRVWSLPHNTHSYLLPIVCQCLPIVHEFFRRFIYFAISCLTHESMIVRYIATYGVLHGRCNSFIGTH